MPGLGKPLQIETNAYAGDKALGYSILKSNNCAPAEVELVKEIRGEMDLLARGCEMLRQRGQHLRTRVIAPFTSEKNAYNRAVSTFLVNYEVKLHELNRKILTLNLVAPTSMHRSPLDIEQMLKQMDGIRNGQRGKLAGSPEIQGFRVQ